MKAWIFGLAAALAGGVITAQVPVTDAEHAADADRVARLNRTTQQRNDAATQRDAAAQAAYARERARYEAALAENDRARASAKAARSAYEQQKAASDAAMAAWQAQIAGLNASNAAKAAASVRTPAARPVALASARAGDAPETAAGPENAMICKRFVETGSLVRSYRTCKTKREWEIERADRRQLSVAGCVDPGKCQ